MIQSDSSESQHAFLKVAAEKRLKRKNSRLDKCGIPEEELYLMQQQLIQQAREQDPDQLRAQAAAVQPLVQEQQVFAAQPAQDDDEYDT